MLIEGIYHHFSVQVHYVLDPKENFILFDSTTNNVKVFNNWKILGCVSNVF